MIYDRNSRIGELTALYGNYAKPILNFDNYDAPLAQWDYKVWYKRICDLDEMDIVRIIFNNIYLEYTISEIIERLRINPALGGHFDGEALECLLKLNNSFWCQNREACLKMINLLKQIDDKKILIPEEQYVDEEDSKKIYKNVNLLLNNLENIKIENNK